MTRFAFLLLLAVAGCSPSVWAPPQTDYTPPAALALAAEKAGDPEPGEPALLSVAAWASRYGYALLPADRVQTWRASYPETGTPVVEFVWQFETRTPGVGLPPELAAAIGLETSLEILTAPAARDSFRARVAGIDAAGTRGPWSEFGTFADTLATPAGPSF